jgi:hypothetical protein
MQTVWSSIPGYLQRTSKNQGPSTRLTWETSFNTAVAVSNIALWKTDFQEKGGKKGKAFWKNMGVSAFHQCNRDVQFDLGYNCLVLRALW